MSKAAVHVLVQVRLWTCVLVSPGVERWVAGRHVCSFRRYWQTLPEWLKQFVLPSSRNASFIGFTSSTIHASVRQFHFRYVSGE